MATISRNRAACAIAICSSVVCCQAQSQSTADRIVSAIEKPGLTRFTPMTESQRVKQYLRRSFGPESFVKSAAAASIGQWRNRPEEWGQGGAGFGKRFASSYAEHLTETTLEFGASNLLHEDNRYFLSQQTGIGSRILYAIESPFLTRRNDGTRRVAFSYLGAMAGAAFLSRAWQPVGARGVGGAGLNMVASAGALMGIDVAREFWPRK